MKPGLYIVATPIGNLGDISIRSENTLREVDIIICENPKHSLKLLTKLGIKKKMYSLHDYNENKIIEKIDNNFTNKSIALISDAGSPLISDPGYKIVLFYIKRKLHITIVPGPSSLIASLQISGMAPNEFKFLGFAPKTKNKFKQFIDKIKIENQTTIFFVSSHRLVQHLEIIAKELPYRNLSLCKELTKINEKVFRGFPKKIIEKIKEDKKFILGEFVLLIEKNPEGSVGKEIINSLVVQQINKLLQKYSLTDVVDIVHKLTNISKNEIYKKTLEQK